MINTLAGIFVAGLSLFLMLIVGYHAVDDLLQAGNWLAAFFMTAMLTGLAIVIAPLLYYFTKNFREFK